MKKSVMLATKDSICPECGKEFTARGLTIDKDKLILVEDRDIHGFMFQACKAFSKSDEIQVLCFNSISKLGLYMKNLAAMENFSRVKTLIVARDAEQNVQSAINSIISAFKKVTYANLPIPEQPFCFVSNDTMKVAFVLFPGPNNKGNCQTGSIEDLCLALFNHDKLLKKCVEPFLECAQLNQEKEDILKHISKSKLHAYLAGKGDCAGKHLSVIAKCKLWEWNDDRIVPFKNIINEM